MVVRNDGRQPCHTACFFERIERKTDREHPHCRTVTIRLIRFKIQIPLICSEPNPESTAKACPFVVRAKFTHIPCKRFLHKFVITVIGKFHKSVCNSKTSHRIIGELAAFTLFFPLERRETSFSCPERKVIDLIFELSCGVFVDTADHIANDTAVYSIVHLYTPFPYNSYTCVSCNKATLCQITQQTAHNSYTCASCNFSTKTDELRRSLTICTTVQVATAKMYKPTMRILCIVFHFL